MNWEMQHAILPKQLRKAFEDKNVQRNLHWQKESSNHIFFTKHLYFFTIYICSPKDTKVNSMQGQCFNFTEGVEAELKTKQLLLVVIQGVAFILKSGDHVPRETSL